MTVAHKLVILRHGESQWNHENKFCGWIDIPLSSKGKEEALTAGQLIAQNNLDPQIIYTSKLTRSIQTGNIILEELKKLYIDQIKTWRLNERHYGKYQGVDKSKVYEELGPEKYQWVRRDYLGLPPQVEQGKDVSIDERYDFIDIPKDKLPTGESLKMVMDRLIPYFTSEILQKNLIELNKTVLIVTHGSVVRSLIKYMNNVSDKDISKINVPTGVPMVFELNDEGSLIRYYYLDKELAEKGIEKVRREGTPR
ncbi:uncharacterized protein PRCAT00005505001 [Priceomyces carsonii]|uniref:uncharacterized protein n=1 Tax=Priceomyces carsonii TaxID=28549 RepID=UPI002ED7E0F8|nr:unnamed protein product [Priceomyces carsonii]